MTPQQSESWKKAIPLLDYMDLQALTEAGLRDFGKRIKTRRGAPHWAIEIRWFCVRTCWNDHEERMPWVPEFALRSEVAMTGLKVSYPHPDERVELYRRLLLDFLARVLTSFEPLQAMCKLCQERSTDDQAWLDTGDTIQATRLHHRKLAQESPQDWPPERAKFDSDCLQMGEDCIHLVRFIQRASPTRWWLKSGSELAYKCEQLHRKRIDEYAPTQARERSSSQYVATAFLAALEAECPPPEWLPPL